MQRIVESAMPGAQILRVRPLGSDADAHDISTKGGGYGAPLCIDVRVGGEARKLVLHTATPNVFGHDRRADRAAEVLLAADTFGELPGHVRVLDVGAYRGGVDAVSLDGTGEFYLLTTYAEGTPYAEDLRRIARTGALGSEDERRHAALVSYLAGLHAPRPNDPAAAYVRALRDTVGGGEGVFGIVDAYPEGVPAAPRDRLERIEIECLRWRGRLRGRHERLRRTHGDFHPFNVLFDERSELAVLDASRGCLGDPADDVTAMAINFAFFSMGHAGAWRGALRRLWLDFWANYARASGDDGLAGVVAPFLAWRGLVLASPVWYPSLSADERHRLLSFVEAALASERFEPSMADEFFDS
ncbi:MAG TPA: aminoglycoside phosphotransferase family protein [Polyangiaceae bacterium]|nr:aminoglycoside phosphotransferase family protein [Polyangiaceae bacterium]